MEHFEGFEQEIFEERVACGFLRGGAVFQVFFFGFDDLIRERVPNIVIDFFAGEMEFEIFDKSPPSRRA